MDAAKLILLIGVSATSAMSAEQPKRCGVDRTGGVLTAHPIDVSPNRNGDRQIVADIDGDGVSDKISWFDPGSGSINPADNSRVTLTLSSSGKSFVLEEQRLQVVKYESKYFVVTRRVESERGPFHTSIYALTKAGITKVCSSSIGIRGVQ